MVNNKVEIEFDIRNINPNLVTDNNKPKLKITGSLFTSSLYDPGSRLIKFCNCGRLLGS